MSFRIVIPVPRNLIESKQEQIKNGLKKGVQRATAEVTNTAMGFAPRRTGTLKRSIHAQVSGAGGNLTGLVVQDAGVAKYGVWVHNGTGIYGPNHSPIVPVNAKMLKFKIGGQTFYRRSVKGQKPNPFMLKAFEQEKGRVPGLILDSVMRELNG